MPKATERKIQHELRRDVLGRGKPREMALNNLDGGHVIQDFHR
jgi:hypothetical protein